MFTVRETMDMFTMDMFTVREGEVCTLSINILVRLALRLSAAGIEVNVHVFFSERD